MRRAAQLLVTAGLALASCTALVEAAPTVRLVEFETFVNPITALRVVQAVDDAEAAGDALVLIRLDTPGGLVTAMETIVKRILAARVPVVVWVGPSGAKAASAGFFILISADVAAMAPGTRTGAASTVFGAGENREDDVLLRKSNQDLAALLRSIAERRQRNVEACERAVFEAQAYEEGVALRDGLIDLVAANPEELLQALDGRRIQRFDGSEIVLSTGGATFVSSPTPARRLFLEALAHPVVAYLLFLAGLIGLYVEFSHPGLILPGVVGALCLLLFALTAAALPISAVGVLLILLAIVMFILEIKVVSYGMLTVGAVICLILGSWMLFDGPIPELRLPVAVFLPSSIVLAAVCILVLRLAVGAQRAPVQAGVERLAAEVGEVTQALDPEGMVFIHGELWHAASVTGPIPRGTRVQVERVAGLKLWVRPAGEAPPRS
jgi:membrane-bound serine protease (ClpP class)